MRRVLVPAAALLAAALITPGAQACDGHGAKSATKLEATSAEVREVRSAHLQLAVSEVEGGYAAEPAGKTCSKSAAAKTCSKAGATKTCSKAKKASGKACMKKKAAAGKSCSKRTELGSAGMDAVHAARLARIQRFADQLRSRRHGD